MGLTHTMLLLLGNQGAGGIVYLQSDNYTDEIAAGGINGTLASDGVSTRTANDTDSKMSQTGGKLIISGAKSPAAFGNPGYYYPAITRAAGQIVLFRFTVTTITNGDSILIGLWSTTTITNVAQIELGIILNDTRIRSYVGNIQMGNLAADTDYCLVFITRATGGDFFILGGAFATWTKLYQRMTGTTASLYPSIANYDNAIAIEQYLAPADHWLPTPLASDGFSSDAPYATDGLGHAEITGVGSGGAGVAWADAVGTWQNDTGKANATVLDGGVAIRVTDTGAADVLAYAGITYSAGECGVVVRYVDASNYVYARLLNDGAYKVTLRKVVGGSDSEVLAPTAVTYSAGAPLLLVCDDTVFRVFYNSLAVGPTDPQQTISDAALLNGTKTGIITTSEANTFDNYRVEARGTGGEYSYLNRFLAAG